MSDVNLAILAELQAIRSLLEKISTTPSLAGWVASPDRNQNAGTSQPANVSESYLVDFCKRIEFCFKDSDTDFIDFRATRDLVRSIVREHGVEYLDQFTRFCEDRLQLHNRAIARPERMAFYFQRWMAGDR